MSGLREVLTLQLGHYSNFVGTHWWNIQESTFAYTASDLKGPKEVNHDVLFREGKNLMGDVTYTPRMVTFDLKGCLNTLKQDGVLYDLTEEEEDLKWTNDVTLHKCRGNKKNEFLQDLDKKEGVPPSSSQSTCSQDEVDMETVDEGASDSCGGEQVFGSKTYDLDDSVNVWSDFLRPHLHPKTVQLLDCYHHNNDLEPFDVFGYGQQAYSEAKCSAAVEDSLHFFIEECDNLQGIQLLADTFDGFGGFSSALVEHLQDDYSNKGILTWGLAPPVFPGKTVTHDCHRLLNTALTFEKLANNSSAFVPLSLAGKLWKTKGSEVKFPHLQYKPNLAYHSGAILAASLDTATLPYRLIDGHSLMTQLTDAMTPCGRKILSLRSSLPLPMRSDGSLVDVLMDASERFPWQPLTPVVSHDALPDVQSLVIRGIAPSRLKGGSYSTTPSILRDCKTVTEVMNLYVKEAFPTAQSAICSIEQPLKVATPFPRIFKPTVSSAGLLAARERPADTSVESFPMVTTLESTAGVGALLKELHGTASRIGVKKFYRFLDAGLEEDDFKETLNSLEALAQCYTAPS